MHIWLSLEKIEIVFGLNEMLLNFRKQIFCIELVRLKKNKLLNLKGYLILLQIFNFTFQINANSSHKI